MLVRSLIILLALKTVVWGQTTPSLATVLKVYVGPMGQSDDAERFRLLLSEELKKARFAIADNADSADGVLTGTVTVQVQAHDTLVFATVVLNAPSGARLWYGDFHPHIRLGRTDFLKLRASEVASALRREVDKASKARQH
jgi:hypothetical protein